jgi:hypothetical protein
LLVSRSHIFLTVKCKGCQYTWAIGLEGLTECVLKEVQAVILARALPTR